MGGISERPQSIKRGGVENPGACATAARAAVRRRPVQHETPEHRAGEGLEPNVQDCLGVQLGPDARAEFHARVPIMQSVPRFMTPGVRRALVKSLAAFNDASVAKNGGARAQAQAWELFALLPCLLLVPTGTDGRRQFRRVPGCAPEEAQPHLFDAASTFTPERKHEATRGLGRPGSGSRCGAEAVRVTVEGRCEVQAPVAGWQCLLR